MQRAIELFQERFTGYSGEVVLCTSSQEAVQRTVSLIQGLGVDTVGLSRHVPGLDALAKTAGLHVMHELPTQVEDVPMVGITAPWGLIAETGSLVIHDNDPGERLWSLVCDVHIAILNHPKVFNDLDELFTDDSAHLSTGLCLISGPSRTADIEKKLVLGMHGPRRVIAMIVGVD